MITLSTKALASFMYGVHSDSYLTYAMRVENREAIEYLLTRGVSPLAADPHGRNAVHYAAEFESLSSLSMLLEGTWISPDRSPDPDQLLRSRPWVLDGWRALDQSTRNDGLLPFHVAAMKGNGNVLKYLAYVGEIRKCAKGERFMEMDDMLEYKAKYQMTPLLLAVQYNRLESFQYLVMIGADIYARNTRMQNTLHLAVINKNEDIVRWLIAKDSDACTLKAGKDYRGREPGHYAKREEMQIALISMWESVRTGNLRDVLTLATRNKDKELFRIRRAQDGNTPLHYAVQLGNVEVARLLVELEAPVDVVNNAGKTPVELAAALDNVEIRSKMQEALGRDWKERVVLSSMQKGGKKSARKEVDPSQKKSEV